MGSISKHTRITVLHKHTLLNVPGVSFLIEPLAQCLALGRLKNRFF